MTLPNNTIFEFYEGTETSKYTELNSTTLNSAPNQLLENDKYLDQEVQSLKESIAGGEIEIQPSQLPKASETQQGIIEIATQEQVSEGRSNITAVTPAYNKVYVDTQINRVKQETKDEILEEIGPVVDEKVEAAVGKVQDEIDGKIDQAVDTAKDSFTDSMQDSIDQAIDDALADGGKLDNAIDDAIQDKIESGEIGGGGDGSSSLVLKPGIIAPLEGATNVSVMVQLQASAYKCLLENEQRKHREFEIATVAEPSTTKFTKEINADTVSVDSQLDPQTQFKWRCRDITVNGLRSAWTSWTTFTTGNAIQVDTPTVTCSEGTTDVPETPTFTTSAFNITPDQGNTSSQHQSTTWRLLSVEDSNAQVWQSENDTVNKTSITLPRGTMQAGKTYIMQAIYNSVSYGSSAAGSVQFTTATEFTHVATPTITITGGAVNVGETPVFNGSPFTILPSGSDTHVSSSWLVTRKSDSGEVYRLDKNTAQKTTLTMPSDLLAEAQTYTVSLIYHSQNYGDSAAGTLDFTCAETFKGIKAPTLSLQGANDDGLVDYAASYVASQFEYIGGTDTCDKVDWELYKGDSMVWSAKNSTILRYLGSFSGYTLEPNTAYVLKYRQHAKTNDVWSSWAELNFTTVNEFTMPTLKFRVSPGGGIGSFNLKPMFLWWDSSKFHVYKNGALDAALTSNLDSNMSVSEGGEDVTIEIKRIDGQNKFPYFCFNGALQSEGYFETSAYNRITLNLLSPLPTLYTAEEGEPVKEFAGGWSHSAIGGPFYNCSALRNIPADLFKYNPQITTFGGIGGGGGYGGGNGYGGYRGGNGGGGIGGGTGGGIDEAGGAGGDGYGCFTNCSGLTSLPDSLFAYCPNVVNFGGIGGGGGGGGGGVDRSVGGGAGGDGYGCFTNCSGLTSLPDSLFAYCPNVVNFGGIGGGGGGGGGGIGGNTVGGFGGAGGDGYGCFTNCSGLTSLPDSLFAYCPNVVNFGGIGGGGGRVGGYGGGTGGAGGDGYGCFTNCSGLTSLPDSLFAYCPNVVNLLGAGNGGGGGGGVSGITGGDGGDGGNVGGVSGGNGGNVSSGDAGRSVVDVTTPHNNTTPTSAKGIFAGCTKLTSVPQNLLRNFGINNNVVGANLIGTFEGCSQLSATLYFDAEHIAQDCVKNFAKGNKAAATVFAKSATTTYNSFHNETTANCNVIPF